MQKNEIISMLSRLLIMLVVAFAIYVLLNRVFQGFGQSTFTLQLVYDGIWGLVLLLSIKIAYWKPMKKIKILPWGKDIWLSRQGSILPFDKLEHLILAFVLAILLFRLLPVPAYKSAAVTIFIGLYWEMVRDGLYTYDGSHIQGASWKDFIADSGGVLIAVALNHFI